MSIIWSNALTVLGLGLFIVFTVLILLVFLLNVFSWFFIKKENPQAALQTIPATTPTTSGAITPAEQAAVAMALHLFYKDVHDEESYVITIGEEKASYSPWNSKIYGLNNNM